MLESDISLLNLRYGVRAHRGGVRVGYNPEMIGHHHVLLATLAQLAKAAALTSSGYEPCQVE